MIISKCSFLQIKDNIFEFILESWILIYQLIMKTCHSELNFQNLLEIFELVEFCNQTLVSLICLSFWSLNEVLDTLANLNHLLQSATELQKHLMKHWNSFDAIFFKKVMVIFVLNRWCYFISTFHSI